MNELMYGIHSAWIAASLLLSMILAVELGFVLGRRAQPSTSEAAKTHIQAILAAMLGILALLLGFTFSLSLQRFDTRSEAVVAEANAIGTAYLRAQLLPEPPRQHVLGLLQDYVDTRVHAGSFTLAEADARTPVLQQSLLLQNQLWEQARRAAEIAPNPVTTGLYIQALNTLIDNFGERDAALNRHVPEVVLLLLYGTFLMAGTILGFSSGVAGHRPSSASYVLIFLMVVLVFIILDLDRPRRGLIEVNQRSLIDLQHAIHTELQSPAIPGRP